MVGDDEDGDTAEEEEEEEREEAEGEEEALGAAVEVPPIDFGSQASAAIMLRPASAAPKTDGAMAGYAGNHVPYSQPPTAGQWPEEEAGIDAVFLATAGPPLVAAADKQTDAYKFRLQGAAAVLLAAMVLAGVVPALVSWSRGRDRSRSDWRKKRPREGPSAEAYCVRRGVHSPTDEVREPFSSNYVRFREGCGM